MKGTGGCEAEGGCGGQLWRMGTKEKTGKNGKKVEGSMITTGFVYFAVVTSLCPLERTTQWRRQLPHAQLQFARRNYQVRK